MLEEIVAEHLEEASFFWELWERALVAPDADLEATAEIEEKMLAHLDGLVEAGPAASKLLERGLKSGEPTRVSSATWALLEWAQGAGLELALEGLRARAPLQRQAVARACELAEQPGLEEKLARLLASQEADLQGTVLGILGFRGAKDTWGLERFLVHGQPGVRCAALRASLCQLQHVCGQWLIPSLTSSTRVVRVAALEAGLAVGLRLAWEVCQQEARAGNPYAMVLLAVGGGEGEVAALRELLSAPRLRAHALWALGFTGRASAAEACLGSMEDKTLAPLAAESFCAITGLQLEGAYALPRPELAQEPPPLEEDDLDADLTPRPEEALPLPEARVVAAWWQRERARFEQGRRYLRGRPYEPAVLLESLAGEPMRRRHVLASELLIRSRGTCLLPTRALTWRQRAACEDCPAFAHGSFRPTHNAVGIEQEKSTHGLEQEGCTGAGAPLLPRLATRLSGRVGGGFRSATGAPGGL